MSDRTITIDEARRAAGTRLTSAGNPSARLEADILLGAATGLDRAQLIARGEQRLSGSEQRQLDDLITRREAGEPIAHLLGTREFWSLTLGVTPDTLIPRPETETLVELALSVLPEQKGILLADLGTGSGAIAAALAHERPHWTLVAIELQGKTLTVAGANLGRLRLNNVRLVQASWLDAVATSTLDAVIANPPYIADTDPHLSRGDLRFEPRPALASGSDGLAAIRAIVAEAPRCLKPHGLIALEHGWDQAGAVRRLLSAHQFEAIATRCDLAGHERVTHALQPGTP